MLRCEYFNPPASISFRFPGPRPPGSRPLAPYCTLRYTTVGATGSTSHTPFLPPPPNPDSSLTTQASRAILLDLSPCLRASLAVCLSTRHSICRSAVCRSAVMTVACHCAGLSACLSIRVTVCLAVSCLSVCLTDCLPVCLSSISRSFCLLGCQLFVGLPARQAGRPTDRYANRLAERQTDLQAGRKTNRQ